MKKTTGNKWYLSRDGQSRNQRVMAALNPLFAKIDERTRKDLIDFAAQYAGELKYFDTATNSENGTWAPFFEDIYEKGIPPLKGGAHKTHMALYLAFLLLLRHAQKHMNRLSARHLDFYYKDVLHLTKKGPTPDKVHLLFSLKKNVGNQMVKAGTLLKAGKDAKGKELFYSLVDDIVVNKARVESLRSVFLDVDGNDNTETIRFAPIANSSDGLGGELDEQEPKWKPFGHSGLPLAEVGFALASPVLLLKEGERTITVTLAISGIHDKKEVDSIGNAFDVYMTGEKGWINPRKVLLDYNSNKKSLIFTITLQGDEGPVVAYDSKIHGGAYETGSPLMRVLLDTENKVAGYRHLKNAVIQKASISVHVEGMKSLTLENDVGTLDASKPFMPFGPNPLKGSNFYFGCEEFASKKVDSVTLQVQWNVPDGNMSRYYENYMTKVRTNDYFTAALYSPEGTPLDRKVQLFKKDATSPVTIPDREDKTKGGRLPGGGLRVSVSPLFITSNSIWFMNILNRLRMIGKKQEYFSAAQKEGVTAGKKGFFTLQLTCDLLQKEYRKVYTNNTVTFAKTKGGTLVLPNEPYIPIIQSISLTYNASTGDVDLTSRNLDDFLSSEIEFFHITPFGHMREHAYQREQVGFVSDTSVHLLPRHTNEGEFYIGLSGITPSSHLSVLLQTAEGSADPASKKADIEWSVLSDNYWKVLGKREIISDTTNSLLTSGIIRFAIPREATDSNTVLPAGFYWLRASVGKEAGEGNVPKGYTGAVCQLIDVRANAALAEFVDRDNDPAHLKTPLPAGTISKAVEQMAALQSIAQPYASFGGKMAEGDESFYTRVSERLRHKHRAQTLWDYERMVLEEFPSIYKAKCISHTSDKSFHSPGHVTVVVLPDLKNKNAVNPLQPGVDKNTLDEVATFLKKHTSGFVRLHVENPSYESIQLDFLVRFHRSYEYGYYRNVLENEIKRFLTPWAFEEGRDIVFGGIIHKSKILDFVEERPYVDYITDFKMYHIVVGKQQPMDTNVARASNPKAILVSSSGHVINEVPEP